MYNEKAIARKSAETILSYTKRLNPPATLLVVNDGSDDGTGDIVERLAEETKDRELIEVISHKANKGYGAALKTGIRFAIERNYDYVIFMDSDLTNRPKYLRAFYEKMVEGWDYIKATRYAAGGGVMGLPLKHRILSRGANILAKVVTGLPLSDITNGFRAVKVALLANMELKEDRFPIIIEELMKARRLTGRFCEIPYILYARDQAAAASKFTYDIITFWKYLKYLFI
jgi:glycosyltransferase involved in cell wall biosynthesis